MKCRVGILKHGGFKVKKAAGFWLVGLDFKGEVLEGNLFVGQQNALLG